jgi:hypothetical protein
MDNNVSRGSQSAVSMKGPRARGESLECPASILCLGEKVTKGDGANDGRFDFGSMVADDIEVAERCGGGDTEETNTDGAETDSIGRDKADVGRSGEGTVGMQMPTVMSGRGLGTPI